MPQTFLNGVSPDYTGFQFTTAIALINQLETTLVAAGWTSLEKTAGVSLFVRGITAVNGHNCWIEFLVSGTSPNLTLTMRGWLEPTKVVGSPNAIHTMTFTAGSINRLWLSADQDAGCICIFDASGACAGYHFGFLIRVDNSDANAWMVGRLYSSGYAYAYVARSIVGSVAWKQIGADYAGGTIDPWTGALSTHNLPLTNIDFLKRIGGEAAFSITASTNPGYLAYQGGRNYDNSVVIDPLCYLEGRNSTTAYGSSGSTVLPFRGFVKYGFCGVSGEAAAGQSTDTISGNKILSVGGSGWQGMRIL
jgi:hypothetical protein